MSTLMRLLPVRVSTSLRAVIDQAGPVNPATRALIILGAANAGMDLRSLEREVAALLSAELTPDVHTALRQVFTHLATAPKERSTADQTPIPNHQPAPPVDTAPPPEQADDPFTSEEAVLPDGQADDPFATIGIDV
jgi:hypothetical protein